LQIFLQIIIIFIFGLAIGSFINALVFRLQNKKKIINDRSCCPKCGHKLTWYQLIPVFSFIALAGKCQYCKKPISWQYPLVELITGLVFILPFFAFKISVFDFIFWQYLLFAFILMIIFAYDFRYMLIPDKITLPAIILIAFIQFFNAGHQALITSYLLAAILASVFFLLQFIISQGAWIGGGDLRLGFLMGLMLGWPSILVALFLAYILGTLISLPLLILKKQNLKTQVPFGIFLTLATIITLLWGDKMLQWYLGFI